MDGRKEQLALIEQLRAIDDPSARVAADELQDIYHAREMAALTADVYDAARGEGDPPNGWLRASENLDLLRELIGDTTSTDEQLLARLQPSDSGFRAEIYIPDPNVLGPGFKPTLAFKGSAGEVLGTDGARRHTASEDFLGNNFPQSVGLQTNYYDQAMDLAVLLRERGLDFDITGHSLGGGLAAAASAVTGMRTVTLNAAGLHPETVARFARENDGLRIYDTARTVTAWHVKGDVLNDGIQGDLASLDPASRRRLAGILADTATMLRKVPEARGRLEQALSNGIPESSHPAIHAFVDRLARGDGAALLGELPQAAGRRMPPLVAMSAQGQSLVAREEAASIADLHRLAGPMLSVLAATARSAEAGRRMGELLEAGGAAARGGLEWTGTTASHAWAHAGDFAGQGYRVAGITIDHGVRNGGELAAQWREYRANAEALALRVGGAMEARVYSIGTTGARGVHWIAGGLPGGLGRDMQERSGELAASLEARARQARTEAVAAAADALERGRADARRYRLVADAVGAALAGDLDRHGASVRGGVHRTGDAVSDALHATGARIDATTQRGPGAGARLGATTGFLVGTVATHAPNHPAGALGLHGTVRLARQAGPALDEGLARHGMATAVIPSLDAEIARRERAARELLDRGRDQAQAAQTPLQSVLRGESGQAMTRFLDALREGDAGKISASAAALLETPPARLWMQSGQVELEARAAQSGSIQQDTEARQAADALLAR